MFYSYFSLVIEQVLQSLEINNGTIDLYIPQKIGPWQMIHWECSSDNTVQVQHLILVCLQDGHMF